MKPSEIKAVVKALYDVRRPVMVWGSPGVGKSTIFSQVADELGVGFLNIKLNNRSPLDFQVPVVQPDGSVKFVTPDLLPTKGKGIILLDELPNAGKELQKLALELVLEFRIGQYKLPKGWVPFAAGNRLKDLAGVEGMISSLSARFIHLDFETDINDWSVYAVEHDVDTSVIAFLRMNPTYLSVFNPKERVSPNPRAWEMVSDVVKSGTPEQSLLEVLSGIVSPAYAAEYLGFRKVFDSLPSVQTILTKPTSADVVAGIGNLYALSMLLVKAVKRDYKNIRPVIKYMQRYQDEHGEFMSLILSLVRSAAAEGGWLDDLQSVPQYREQMAILFNQVI